MGANTVGLFLLRYKEPMNLVTYCLIKKYQIPCCLYIKFYDLAVIINHFFAFLRQTAATLLASALSY